MAALMVHQPTQPTTNHSSKLIALTLHLADTYRRCNGNFKYESTRNPKRTLTKPAESALNNGYDNIDNDYILIVNDIIGDKPERQYQILDILGKGTFGQVVKCRHLQTNKMFAVKVIKNKPAYYSQSLMEVKILDTINTKSDMKGTQRIVKMIDNFVFRNHLCLVFELLSINLFELIKQNHFRGLSTNLVYVFAEQILDALIVLEHARVIHCDLKPENILLQDLQSPTIKVIDFGSACYEYKTIYSYIQSRFYRSPEVLLGVSYNKSIDMWSLGCICAELFLGVPIFPGSSEYNQLSRIIDLLGMPPVYMIEQAKNCHKYFEKGKNGEYRLKSMEQYSKETGNNEKPSKKYFEGTDLRSVVTLYPLRKQDPGEAEKEMSKREIFLDFLRGLLTIDPQKRWTASEAKQHPFITGDPFTGPFVPDKEKNALSSVQVDNLKSDGGLQHKRSKGTRNISKWQQQLKQSEKITAPNNVTGIPHKRQGKGAGSFPQSYPPAFPDDIPVGYFKSTNLPLQPSSGFDVAPTNPNIIDDTTLDMDATPTSDSGMLVFGQSPTTNFPIGSLGSHSNALQRLNERESRSADDGLDSLDMQTYSTSEAAAVWDPFYEEEDLSSTANVSNSASSSSSLSWNAGVPPQQLNQQQQQKTPTMTSKQKHVQCNLPPQQYGSSSSNKQNMQYQYQRQQYPHQYPPQQQSQEHMRKHQHMSHDSGGYMYGNQEMVMDLSPPNDTFVELGSSFDSNSGNFLNSPYVNKTQARGSNIGGAAGSFHDPTTGFVNLATSPSTSKTLNYMSNSLQDGFSNKASGGNNSNGGNNVTLKETPSHLILPLQSGSSMNPSTIGASTSNHAIHKQGLASSSFPGTAPIMDPSSPYVSSMYPPSAHQHQRHLHHGSSMISVNGAASAPSSNQYQSHISQQQQQYHHHQQPSQLQQQQQYSPSIMYYHQQPFQNPITITNSNSNSGWSGSSAETSTRGLSSSLPVASTVMMYPATATAAGANVPTNSSTLRDFKCSDSPPPV